MNKDFLKNKIKDKIRDANIFLNGDLHHLQMLIVSKKFENKNKLERQKIIHNILHKYFLNKKIHSLEIEALTKIEWKNKK